MRTAYNFRWKVVVPAKQFLAGTHRFRTKKEAQGFWYKWVRTKAESGEPMTYENLPRVEKD